MNGTSAQSAGGDKRCECYINTADIRQDEWQKNPRECLRSCKAQFLRSVSETWEEENGWIDGCRTLNNGLPRQEFWALYWCDSRFCGVGIDPTGGLGQDRE